MPGRVARPPAVDVALSAIIGITVVLGGCSVSAPPREAAPTEVAVAGWPIVPVDAPLGEVTAIDIDSSGNVYVLHRAGRQWREPFPSEPITSPTVSVFEGSSGRLLARWGSGMFVMPHGLSIDRRDKVWVTDVGLEQVFRFNRSGELELTLGKRGISGKGSGQFGRPTDVAFAGDEVFVADGYRNSRVAVFDRRGQFLRRWGEPGAGSRGLEVPHAIAIYRGTVYVADRENGRLQITDLKGTPRGNWSHKEVRGHPYSVKVLGDGRVVSLEGRDAHDRRGAMMRIWKRDGAVASSIDLAPLDARDSLGHDFAIAPDGSVYVADPYGARVRKFRMPGLRR